MPCVILEKKGECRWERDGNPVGIFPGKYEWSGSPETGDCSLRILDANLEYDDGVWQCQVTPSSFATKDSLISEGAELVVRGKFCSKLTQKSPTHKSYWQFSILFALCAWNINGAILTSPFQLSYQNFPLFRFDRNAKNAILFSKKAKGTFVCQKVQQITLLLPGTSKNHCRMMSFGCLLPLWNSKYGLRFLFIHQPSCDSFILEVIELNMKRGK